MGRFFVRSVIVITLVVMLSRTLRAEIVISEWMYNGLGSGGAGEFIEFTNTGPAAVNMGGWSFDDDSRTPGTVDLSAFGTVAPGQSVILSEESAAAFAANWNLNGTMVIGDNSANLGRNDEINLFDDGGMLVDRLTYGDQNLPGTIRTQGMSGNIPPSDYGFTEVQTSWVLATVGDVYGSKTSSRGEIGSPGAIPEPATLTMLGMACLAILRRRK